MLFGLGVPLRAVRPELVEGQPFDRLRANGTKWHTQTEQYWVRSTWASPGDPAHTQRPPPTSPTISRTLP